MEKFKPVLIAIVALALLALGFIWFTTPPAQAADLGGNCCADLEDRVAELEAITAKKGNRKVSLTITGSVNAGILHLDAGDFDDTKVVHPGTDESFVAFRGNARVSPDLTAGFNVEFDLRQLGLLDSGIGEQLGPRVRQSYVYLKSESLGAVSVGRQGQATNDFDKITTANTAVATRPLSLQPISDIYLTGLDLPFDGTYRDLVKYTSPVWGGFQASASYGAAIDGTSADGNGSTYDVALRYSGELSGIGLAGGVGWRHDEDLKINVVDILSLTIPTGDVETISAVGSVKHMLSGVFATVNYADQDWKTFDFTLKSWQATAGVERKFFAEGATTLYGEYNVITLDGTDVDLYGAGLVQALDAAAMDLYVAYKHYDLGDAISGAEIDTYTAGMRVKF